MLNSKTLVDELRTIAKGGPIRSVHPGPSGIAATLKELLKMDSGPRSSKYGFKISTSKLGQTTRITLFAKVPDWDNSTSKSSAEVLEKYGYGSGADRRLNCTMENSKPNGQGLFLEFNEDNSILFSKHKTTNMRVCSWPVADLKEKLSEKYEASAQVEYSIETLGSQIYFQVTGVRFFGHPSISHFEKLVRRGSITLDHVIGIDKNGGVHEKGPLFKISRADFLTLFPSTEYVKFN